MMYALILSEANGPMFSKPIAAVIAVVVLAVGLLLSWSRKD